MSIGSPLASESDDASACWPSWLSAPTACLSAEPKSVPEFWPALAPDEGSFGASGERPPIGLIGIYRGLLLWLRRDPGRAGGERRTRDAHAAEETHASVPAFPLVLRSVRQATALALGMRVPIAGREGTGFGGYSGTPTARSSPSFLIAGLVTVKRMIPAAGA